MPPATGAHRRPARSVATLRYGRLGLVLAILLAYASAASSSGSLPRAWSDTRPPVVSTPSTVSSDPLPTVQIDGVVWSQAVVGNTVYAGGQFTNARPAGAASGTQLVPRSSLLAYDLSTGVLKTTFTSGLPADSVVKTVVASPDGRTLYAGGLFSSYGGAARSGVVALDAATGALKTTFNAGAVNGQVTALAATSTTVYLAGWFTAVGGATRRSIAAVNASTGAVTNFNPIVTDGYGESVTVSPDQSRVVIGGRFLTTNGSAHPGYGMAIVDAATGRTNLPMSVNEVIRNGTSKAAITSLFATTDGFYGTAFTYSPAGNFEGTFKASWNGDLVWLEDCHGDTYSVYQAPSTASPVYIAGHPHYCGNIGGFPQTSVKQPWAHWHALAFTPDVKGVVGRDSWSYTNFTNRPRPDLLSWFPDFTIGTFTGQNQGPWSVNGNSDYLVYGGEFVRVNGTLQQGLVRFAKPSLAPNRDGPRLSGAQFVPTLQSFAQGVRIVWPANHDRDNEQLTYTLIRNGDTAHPVFTTTRRSTFWQQPVISYLDTAARSGTFTYRLTATDPFGNTVVGADASITASGGTSLSAYDQRVLNDDPTYFWRLNEPTGTTVFDLGGRDGGATRQSGATQGATGAIVNDPGAAYHFNGSASGTVATDTARLGLQTFSVETWFKTTSSTGGRLIGFSSSQTGTSTTADRHLYLTNSGRVYWGTARPVTDFPGLQTISSPATGYNDGRWHHVAAVQDPAQGAQLFVDGVRVAARSDYFLATRFNGYWRLGGDSLATWPEAPSSGYYTGDLDDPAVYNVPLTSAQILAHYNLGKGGPVNASPTASFTSSCTALSCTFNGSGSADPDGTISGYAWDFGDGTTGSGATATHTYAAVNTYSVRLTVTDNGGATGATTRTVSTTDPGGRLVSDSFTRTVATGWGSAPTGGTWTQVGAASLFSVANGVGSVRNNAGSGPASYLQSVSASSVDLSSSFSLDKVPTGSGVYVNSYARRILDQGSYYAKTRVLSSGAVSVELDRANAAGAEVVLQAPSTIAGLSFAAGDALNVRVQATGTSPTTVRARVWKVGTVEPSTWQRSVTDSTAGLQAAGHVGFSSYLSGSATNAPITISYDNVVATSP